MSDFVADLPGLQPLATFPQPAQICSGKEVGVTTAISVSEARAFAQKQQIIFDQVHDTMLELDAATYASRAGQGECAQGWYDR